jgi:hypothetical protein
LSIIASIFVIIINLNFVKMRPVFFKIAAAVVAAPLLFSACTKKELVEETNEKVNTLYSLHSRTAKGSISAIFEGKFDGYTNYTKETYEEKREFKYIINRSGAVSSYATTQKFIRDNADKDLEYDYTVTTFNIKMFTTEGVDVSNKYNDEYISFNFKVYEGDLSKNQEDYNIKEGVPSYIEAEYSIVYNSKNTIDYININDQISYDDGYSYVSSSSILREDVDIKNFAYDEKSGKISFEFTIDANSNDDMRKAVESGKVSTYIMENRILQENNYMNY